MAPVDYQEVEYAEGTESATAARSLGLGRWRCVSSAAGGTTSGKFLTSLEMSAFGQSSTGAKGTLVLTRALEDEIQARSG